MPSSHAFRGAPVTAAGRSRWPFRGTALGTQGGVVGCRIRPSARRALNIPGGTRREPPTNRRSSAQRTTLGLAAERLHQLVALRYRSPTPVRFYEESCPAPV